MSTSTTAAAGQPAIKREDSPEPEPPPYKMPAAPEAPITTAPAQVADPKDPEGFLRRCAGYNRKKKDVRCSAVIGKNSHQTKNTRPTYLPTCHAHRDQLSFAGWCQFQQDDGETCGTLFRWAPPNPQLCDEHLGHPNTPCYFMRLPLELRHEIYRYLLPSKPIGSSTSPLHVTEEEQPPTWVHMPQHQSGPVLVLQPTHDSVRRHSMNAVTRAPMGTVFPMPLMNLLLVSRQMKAEVKDLLYDTVPFTIDVRKDGTYMCGRRLLEPRRADGSSHFGGNDADTAKAKFLSTFDWAAVKNYNVDILVENWQDEASHGHSAFQWDEEVEIYDIRDYVGVVVSGILAKSRYLCKLNVRLGLSKFAWESDVLLANFKAIFGPFERLRNVNQPRFRGIYEGTPQYNNIITLPLHPPPPPSPLSRVGPRHLSRVGALCSVPQLPTTNPLRVADDQAFEDYRLEWERSISLKSSISLVRKPAIRTMFTEFKEFYTKLSTITPEVTARTGKHAFLHRARVAREQENVTAFRLLRNELIEYWYTYLEQVERRKEDMDARLSRMLDADTYPGPQDETPGSRRGSGSTSAPSSSVQSPVILDKDTMDKEGIPMQGNVLNESHEIRAWKQQKRLQFLYERTQRQAQMTAQRQQQQQQALAMQAHQAALQNANPQGQGNLPSPPPHVHFQQAQQALALNPQPPYRPVPASPSAISPAARLQSSVQAQQQYARRLAARSPFVPTVAQPQNIAMPVMPQRQQQMLQQQQQQQQQQSFGALRFQRALATSPIAPAPSLPSASILSLSPHQSDSEASPSSWPFDAPWQPDAAEQPESRAVGGLPTPESLSRGHKRYSLETDGVEEVGLKKRRVNSATVEVNENGDEVMVIDDDYVWRGWEGEQGLGEGKGKGKAVWVEG